MRANLRRVRDSWIFLLFLFFSYFLQSASEAKAQLWEVPPLPPVKDAPASDGMTATVGNESVHISVCSSSVIHFVATPERPDKVLRNQPWMLDSKESCPGAKFQLSEEGDTAVLTTDTLKVELSLKWGNVQYSTVGNE